MVFDIVLKGGHVIDPKNGIDEAKDVGIQGGKIAAVDAGLPVEGAGKVVDVGRCCSSSSAVRSSRISTSLELEPPHADPTNNKQSKTTG